MFERAAEVIRRCKFKHGLRRVTPKCSSLEMKLEMAQASFSAVNSLWPWVGTIWVRWFALDYYFYIRMAVFYNLYQLKEVLAEVGIGDNESMKRDVLIGFIVKSQEAREAMAGREVPNSWIKMSPRLVSNYLHLINENWDADIRADEIETQVASPTLPAPSKRKELLDRILLGTL